MIKHSEVFVAFDTSKLRNAVAIAEAGRAGEVRFLGEIENTAEAITKLVRRTLVECAWSYQYPPRVGIAKQAKVAAREIAWKAQCRLNRRYRVLLRRGKLKTVAITAVARELAGFLWAAARELSSPPSKMGYRAKQ